MALPDTRVSSYFRLAGVELTDQPCQGTACFVARHRAPQVWSRARADDPRVYCLGRCHEAPVAVDTPEIGPEVFVDAPTPVVLEGVVVGTAPDLDSYRAAGGYVALERAVRAPSEVVGEVDASGLRGRGGAGFSTGRKWRAVRDQPGETKYVIANADEGDPGAYVDRVMLERDPHRVLEGLAIAATAVGARRAFVYVRKEYPRARSVLAGALAEAYAAGVLGATGLGADQALDVEIVDGEGSYVCGEETALLNAIEGRRPGVRARPPYPAATIVEEGLVDRAFIEQRVDGFGAFAEFVDGFLPEGVADTCGVAPTTIRDAARLYAGSSPSMAFHGLGLTEHRQGTEGVMCLVNLALLTGNLGRPGTGVNPLRGQNNVQGSAHMGCEPAHLPGYVPLDVGQELVSEVWGAEVPVAPGLDAMEMLDAAGRGDLRALVVAGWDLLATQPDATTTQRALRGLDTLIVIDLFLTESARECATVVLPAASSYEKDGTFMNSERRVQRIRAAVPPPGEAEADWRIVARLAGALGRGSLFAYDDAEAIWEEIRQVWAPGAGISYPRLEAPGGLQWPCPTEDHPGTTILHGDTFGQLGPKTTLRTIPYEPTPECTDTDFPLLLVTGRNLYAFNAGTMTGRSATRMLRPTDTLEICAEDASSLGIDEQSPVVVRSRYGHAALQAEITERVPPGTVFATFHDPSIAINRVTGPHRDNHTNTPEYKVTAVHVEPAAARG